MRKRADLVDDIEERAAFLEECGADFCLGTPSARTAPTGPRAAAPRPAGPGRPMPAAAPARRPPGRPPLSRAEPVVSPAPPAATFASFGDLEAAVRACTRCPLCRLRTQAVPGEGDLKTELMFVGEAPGRDEDAQGRPFVGRAGQLLRRIITNAMHFREDEVYITNVVKCRPPENRVPARDEIEACSPYLVQQIALIKPRVIVTLGKTPADFFIPSRRAMGELRGNFFEYLGIPLMPTFHPSYLVRNEGNQELKRMVWEDMKKVLARLGRT